jgi:hypothetical protein
MVTHCLVSVNITTALDIFHHVEFLRQNISETGSCDQDQVFFIRDPEE